MHGGAWNIPDEIAKLHARGAAEASLEGMKVLMRGGSALDAVESAIRNMEDKVVFNAGRGAVKNREGEAELDAIIMEGGSLRAGAVAAVKNIPNPITLARKVMELTEHVLIVGEGANKFARQIGLAEHRFEDLLSEEELRQYRSLLGFKAGDVKQLFGGGTVGAVAIDGSGNLAAGTSTGGTPGKLPGRVGDSPLPGCGAYADNATGAVSATGWGESIMRLVLSKQACDLMGGGLPPEKACEQSIKMLAQRVGGWGGLIAIGSKGGSGSAYNTRRMARAMMTEDMDAPDSSV